ncbi:DNA cytosine methyltransferase [bacterium]|nr:DNA cytosine methyltransferase [bacterium]
MTYLDLFAGLGGFTQALAGLGLDCQLALDNDPHCQQTYTHNFSYPFLLEDIRHHQQALRHIKSPVTLITAGFPCQSFSKAGQKQGFTDKQGRGQLFFDLLEIVKKVQPSALLLENVAHLQKHNQGQTFATILQELAAIGYHLHYSILNATDISGLPQNRQRLYLVGFKNAESAKHFAFPPSNEQSISFKTLLEKNVAPKYYLKPTALGGKLQQYQFQPSKIYVWRRYYLRTHTDKLCPTLMASMGTGGYNVPMIVDHQGLRRLTPRECARLQGLPETFTFPDNLAEKYRYQQLGNSVSVPTVRAIIKQLLAVLE